jgi:hypothetical protein
MSAARSRSEQWIVRLFVVVVGLLPVQYWIARTSVLGEPYPALIMPAFDGRVTTSDGKIPAESVGVVVTFADGTVEPLPLRTLFARAPSSHIIAMAQIALKPKPPRPLDRPPDPWWRALIKQYVVPGLALRAARTQYWSGPDPRTVAWLRARMQEVFPGRRASEVRVEWYSDTYEWRGDRWQRQRNRTTSLTVPL